MKKLLAVILSAVLMLSTCAFAEGPEAGTCYCLSGISVEAGETNIDLSDLKIGVDVMKGEPGAVAVHVDNGDERVCEIGFTQVDGLSIMHLDSPTLGHKDYAIDPVMELANSLDEMRNGLIEALQGMDTTAAAQTIFDFFYGADEAAPAEEEPVEEEPAETPEPGLEVTGDIGAILEESVNPEKTVTIDEDVTDPDTGEVLVPAGEYKVSSFTVDKELLVKILGNMTLNGEPIPNIEMLKDEDTDAQMVGGIYEGQGDLQTSVGYMFITASAGEIEGYNGMYYIMSTDEDGTTFTFDVLGDGGESHLDAQFVVEKHPVAEGAFSTDDVDMANVVNLSELAAAGEESPLAADMQTWLGDVIGALVIAMIGEVPAE